MLVKIIRKIVLLFAILETTFLFVASLFLTSCEVNAQSASGSPHFYFLSDYPLVHIGVIVLILFLLVRAEKCREKTQGNKLLNKRTAKILQWTIGAVFVALYTFLVFYADFQPVNDQYEIYTAVQKLWQGDNGPFRAGGYINCHPNQNGLFLIEYLLYPLLGSALPAAAQILNIFLILMTYIALSRGVREWLPEAEGQSVSLKTHIVLFLFIPYALYCTFVYGNIPAQFLITLAIYWFTRYDRTEKPKYGIFCILSIAAACFLKSNSYIPLIAIAIFMLLGVLKKKYLWKRNLLLLLLLIVVAAGVNTGAKRAVTLVSGVPEGDGCGAYGVPASSFVAMGLQENVIANGFYNGYNVQTYEKYNFNTEKADQVSRAQIRTSLGKIFVNPRHAAGFFGKKLLAEWNDPTFNSFDILEQRTTRPDDAFLQSLTGGTLREVLTGLLNILQTVILFGTLAYFLLRWRNGNMIELLPSMIFTGGFLFHTVWEGSPKYTIYYFLLMIPYSMIGYHLVVNWLQTRKSGRQLRNEK